MRGDNHVLALTVTTDQITGDITPLFAFPVQVCKATDEREVKFDIAAPSGAAREQRYADKATGELITDDQCMRGIRVGDEFKAIPQESIDAINEATKINTMVALGNIDYDAIPRDRVTGKYFLQSPVKGGSPKAYRITYEAMLGERKGIVTKRTARSRQKLAIIYADPEYKCLMMLELSFAAQQKAPDEQVLAPQAAQVEQAQIEAARKVIATKLGDGLSALANEADDAVALKANLIEQALAGETLAIPTPIAETAEATDLTSLLEASLAG